MKSIFFILLIGIILGACSGSYSSTQDNSENAIADSTQQSDFWYFDDTDPYLNSNERPEEMPVVHEDPRVIKIQPVPPE